MKHDEQFLIILEKIGMVVRLYVKFGGAAGSAAV